MRMTNQFFFSFFFSSDTQKQKRASIQIDQHWDQQKHCQITWCRSDKTRKPVLLDDCTPPSVEGFFCNISMRIYRAFSFAFPPSQQMKMSDKRPKTKVETAKNRSTLRCNGRCQRFYWAPESNVLPHNKKSYEISTVFLGQKDPNKPKTNHGVSDRQWEIPSAQIRGRAIDPPTMKPPLWAKRYLVRMWVAKEMR